MEVEGDLLPGQGDSLPGPPARAVLAGGVAPLPQGGADGSHHLTNGQLLSSDPVFSHSWAVTSAARGVVALQSM